MFVNSDLLHLEISVGLSHCILDGQNFHSCRDEIILNGKRIAQLSNQSFFSSIDTTVREYKIYRENENRLCQCPREFGSTLVKQFFPPLLAEDALLFINHPFEI